MDSAFGSFVDSVAVFDTSSYFSLHDSKSDVFPSFSSHQIFDDIDVFGPSSNILSQHFDIQGNSVFDEYGKVRIDDFWEEIVVETASPTADSFADMNHLESLTYAVFDSEISMHDDSVAQRDDASEMVVVEHGLSLLVDSEAMQIASADNINQLLYDPLAVEISTKLNEKHQLLNTVDGTNAVPNQRNSISDDAVDSIAQSNDDNTYVRALLSEPVVPGDYELFVDIQDGFQLGMSLRISPGTENEETRYLVAFGSLICDEGVQYHHPVGTVVIGILSPAATMEISGHDKNFVANASEYSFLDVFSPSMYGIDNGSQQSNVGPTAVEVQESYDLEGLLDTEKSGLLHVSATEFRFQKSDEIEDYMAAGPSTSVLSLPSDMKTVELVQMKEELLRLQEEQQHLRDVEAEKQRDRESKYELLLAELADSKLPIDRAHKFDEEKRRRSSVSMSESLTNLQNSSHAPFLLQQPFQHIDFQSSSIFDEYGKVRIEDFWEEYVPDAAPIASNSFNSKQLDIYNDMLEYQPSTEFFNNLEEEQGGLESSQISFGLPLAADTLAENLEEIEDDDVPVDFNEREGFDPLNNAYDVSVISEENSILVAQIDRETVYSNRYNSSQFQIYTPIAESNLEALNDAELELADEFLPHVNEIVAEVLEMIISDIEILSQADFRPDEDLCSYLNTPKEDRNELIQCLINHSYIFSNVHLVALESESSLEDQISAGVQGSIQRPTVVAFTVVCDKELELTLEASLRDNIILVTTKEEFIVGNVRRMIFLVPSPIRTEELSELYLSLHRNVVEKYLHPKQRTIVEELVRERLCKASISSNELVNVVSSQDWFKFDRTEMTSVPTISTDEEDSGSFHLRGSLLQMDSLTTNIILIWTAYMHWSCQSILINSAVFEVLSESVVEIAVIRNEKKNAAENKHAECKGRLLVFANFIYNCCVFVLYSSCR